MPHFKWNCLLRNSDEYSRFHVAFYLTDNSESHTGPVGSFPNNKQSADILPANSLSTEDNTRKENTECYIIPENEGFWLNYW